MQIYNKMYGQGGSETLHETVFSAAEGSRSAESIAAREHFTAVYLNEKPFARIVCTPRQIAEMVLGRLYTAGAIERIDDVENISVNETGTQVHVRLSRGATQSSGKINAVDDPLIQEVFGDAVPQPVQPIVWQPEWIYSLTRYFESGVGTPLFVSNHSVHSAILAQEDNVLFCCEDIGRHNAIDKVVGCALQSGVDLTQCILFSSGRLPTDMVAKAIRAGIPILCAKAACTDKAAQLARAFDLTLITRARSGSFALQNSPALK